MPDEKADKRPWYKTTTARGLVVAAIGEGLSHATNPYLAFLGWTMRALGAGIATWGVRTHAEKVASNGIH